MQLCLEVAPHFPGLRLQSWDVVICQDGPILMELNTEADLGVPQAVTRRGMLDERTEVERVKPTLRRGKRARTPLTRRGSQADWL